MRRLISTTGILFSLVFPAYAVEKILYPEWWGELRTNANLESECPDIKGVFLIKGAAYELFDGNATSASQNGYESAYANGMLDFDKKPLSKEPSSDALTQDQVSLNLDENQLTFILPEWENKKILESYQFRADSAEYECKHGWLKFKDEISSVNSENSTIKFKTHRSIGRLKDGSLLVIKEQEIKNGGLLWFNSGEKVIRQVYAKFLPASKLNQ